MNTKMDSLVTMVTDIKERTVALADLPQQLQAGFSKVSGEISSFRKMVMQVGGRVGWRGVGLPGHVNVDDTWKAVVAMVGPHSG
jgi:hypothetical protein